MEPLLAVTIVAGTLLLAAGVSALWMGRRRRIRSHPAAIPGLIKLINGYEGQCPPFHRIMKTFAHSEELAGRLLEDREVQEALRLLGDRHPGNENRKRRKGGRGTVLALTPLQPVSEDQKISPEMLTVLRSVYFNPDLRRHLSREAESELDNLLDSLTELGAIG